MHFEEFHNIKGLNAVPPYTQENREEHTRLFFTYTSKGENEFIQIVRERFEHTENARDRLAFHNSEHTESVIERTGRILKAIQKALPHMVSDRDIALGRFSAAAHDTMQIWSERDGERKRDTENNEFQSTRDAFEFMRKSNIEAAQEIYTADDFATVGYALHATIPKFNSEQGTVIQPGLLHDVPLVAQALALADLGTAGMDGPERFLKEGNALFREEKLDVLEMLQYPEVLTNDQIENICERIRKWSWFQVSFAVGRKALLDAELEGIPEEARESVWALFSHFDESIDAARAQAVKRDSMDFKSLLHDIGY